MFKIFILIIFNLFLIFPSYSNSTNEYNNQENGKSSIRVDLLFGAGYMMWVCTHSGNSCSSAFTITNGTAIEVEKGDTFYVGIAALPRICDFYKVTNSNSLAVISYWGTVFKPNFNIFGDETIQFLNRETTYNLIAGCQQFQGKYNEKY
ncbi:hypothetical protein [Fluviispira multicolorata]|uniref:Uncharacterized protein n=1 Tax=Fluviispira multicolorata TaxID=2654512 RepID=A0A833JEC1_9BACT|nr:hypothetical protein [Fluviispira multicolorata]KAB8031804.1 hypothetical protein GCL57_03955 [Fluviispira multicolorata]